MGNQAKNIIKYAVSAVVTVLLLYFSFKNVQWRDFWAAIKACRWEFILLSMLFGVVSFFTRSLRWQMLLKPIDPATRIIPVFNAINISYVVNMVLPRVGELVRCGYITKNSSEGPDGKKRATYDKVLGTVVVDRGWDALTLIILMGGLMLLLWNRFGRFFSDNMLGPASERMHFNFSFVLLGVVLLVVAGGVFVWMFRRRSGVCAKICEVFSGIWTGVTRSLHLKRGWLFAVYTLVIWLMYWLQCLAVVWAVQAIDPAVMSPQMLAVYDNLQAIGPVDALFLMMVGALSSLVPVPGGFGAFHYLVSLALSSMYGIPLEVGVIFATLSHESQAVIQLLCGGASYLWETLRK